MHHRLATVSILVIRLQQCGAALRHGGPGVDLLVLPEHSLHGEAFLADVALVRPLSSVRADVLPQPGPSGEASAADVTHKLPRPLVEHLVVLQLLGGGEIFVAQEAAVKSCLLSICSYNSDHIILLLRMFQQVFLQQARPVEALGAQRAGMRLLPGVEPHVVPEG